MCKNRPPKLLAQNVMIMQQNFIINLDKLIALISMSYLDGTVDSSPMGHFIIVQDP
jgi:hypothetical protein